MGRAKNERAAVRACATVQRTVKARIDPRDARIVYAATDTGINAGVWRSTDGGNTWTVHTQGLPANFRLSALAIDPATPSTLYAATRHDGVHVSADSGRSWSATGAEVSNESVTSLAIDPREPSTVYAGTSTAGVFKSIDGGTTWSAPASSTARRVRAHALAIDAGNPAVVWVGAVNGMLRSADGGRTWADAMPALEYAAVRAVAPDSARSLVFAGTTRDGV